MLTQVPSTTNASARLVVLRHPNSIACTVLRKQVTRIEVLPGETDASEIGGMPTLGGMVLGQRQPTDPSNAAVQRFQM